VGIHALPHRIEADSLIVEAGVAGLLAGIQEHSVITNSEEVHFA
jgi:hypothetical protein